MRKDAIMKTTLIAVMIFTSTLLAGCCSNGCDSGGGWGNAFSSNTYATAGSCASSCCGSGSW